jgi:DNA-binding response OmpR family regulator
VLIVEDEPDMVLGLQDNCEYEGYEVLVARDGAEGLERALAERPDLILLDVMLPKLSGLDVCRTLRQRGLRAPIIMLTARSQETDKVVGLEVGADDYVTKPFGVRELMARIRAQLRRATGREAEIDAYRFGEIELDFRRHHATRAGKPLALSPREFALLKYFIQRRGEAIAREELLDNVWGLTRYPFTRTVDNHIAKLRRKLERSPAEPAYIITVHKVGYKFLG